MTVHFTVFLSGGGMKFFWGGSTVFQKIFVRAACVNKNPMYHSTVFDLLREGRKELFLYSKLLNNVFQCLSW